MIKINIRNEDTGSDLIDPVEMIGSSYGAVFQQYQDGKPLDSYYISCGGGEKSVVQLWFANEDDEYRLSTDNAKSLGELYESIKVKRIDATIEINLITGE